MCSSDLVFLVFLTVSVRMEEMNDYKIGTLVDSKYFLQAVLEDRELCTTYRVWHTEWEVSLLARISKDVEKNVYHT